jgi:Uma2 family endonuclease
MGERDRWTPADPVRHAGIGDVPNEEHTMSALAVEHEPDNGHGWDELVRIWEQTDAPEGCKVEIIEGTVTVTPPPSGDHAVSASTLQRRLYAKIPEDWEIFQNLGLALPGRSELYVPDLVVVPRELVVGRKYAQAEDALLVVEITSPSNGSHDRITKVHGYAEADVPLYLLLDQWRSGNPTATLYGDPADGTYRVLDVVKYGDPIRLPAPFDLTLDTGEFPVS